MHNGLRILGLLWACSAAVPPGAARETPAVTPVRLEKMVAVLAKHPPGFAVDPVRERVFLDLDQFIESAVRPGQPFDLSAEPVRPWAWVARRVAPVLDEAAVPATAVGQLAVWQMYNMGLICRAGNVVAGMDLIAVPGAGSEFRRRVAALVDVLLVTHAHPDHFDADLVQACLDAGKPVFVSAAIAAEREPHPRLHAIDEAGEFDVAGIHIVARRGVHVWAGSRDDTHMIYYEVTFPAGHTVIFCGDLDYTREFEKTPGQTVDLLVIPWRSPNELYEPGSPRQVAGHKDAVQIALDRIQPQYLLFSHYAELLHVLRGMPASYEIAVGLKRTVAVPSEFLFWGESLRLPAAAQP